MMIKKPKRAGLAAFIFAVLLGLCLTLSFHTRVYAHEGPKRMLAQFR